jgi:NDP-sugar pyrophosphorylase family protein
MWWADLQRVEQRLTERWQVAPPQVDPAAVVEPGAVLDEGAGPIAIGPGTRVCAGAIVRGPIAIGADCLVGNQAMVRGASIVGNGVRIGFACEVKHAVIDDRATLGPMSFVADSVIERDVYLGAMVRTSNHRLDRAPVTVRAEGREIATGCEKLGCRIGAGASLGIQVIVLPGREIAAGSLFEPRITVSRNYPPGHYRIRQEIEFVE